MDTLFYIMYQNDIIVDYFLSIFYVSTMNLVKQKNVNDM